MKTIFNGLQQALQYLTKWFNFEKTGWLYSLNKLRIENDHIPSYNDFTCVVALIPKSYSSKMSLDMEGLFDEVTLFTKTTDLFRQNYPNFDKLSTEEKNTNIFSKNDIVKNIIKIMSFVFSMHMLLHMLRDFSPL
jgi:hypothetical protein